MLNIDELRAWVNYLKGEYIIVLTNIKKLYIISLKNRKFITIIKTIIINGRDPLLLFIIALKQKIIDNWVHKNLVKKEKIIVTLIRYINNNIAI